MSKKLILVLMIVVFFFSLGRFVYASLAINEIMYDLSGSDSVSGKSREWIEIYNPDLSNVSIDASKWRIYDGSGNRTINGGVNFSIPSLSYVIFAGDKDTFLVDNPSFSGVVYDTGITSLNNTNATIKILDQNGNTVDSVTYSSSQGGAGDGNSLQLINSSWIGATPTPGAVNNAGTQPPSGSGGTGTSDNSGDSSSVLGDGGSQINTSTTNITKNKTTTIEISKIKTQIITNKTLGLSNIPLSFQAKTLGYQGEPLNYGKYFWNFGDGYSKEIQVLGSQPFTHAYFYPGNYIVSLEYYSNSYSDVPDASAQTAIKIIGADVSISRVGDEKDFFVELSNSTDYNIDLSNWYLISDQKSFMIPRNTIMEPQDKLIISSKITNFSIIDKNSLKLVTPEGDTVFNYSSLITPIVVQNSTIQNFSNTVGLTNTNSKISKKTKNTLNPDATFLSSTSFPTDNLTALVASSDVSTNNGQDNSPSINSMTIYIISFIFIGASAYAVYFIRRKKVVSQNGNDFEILDE